MRSSLTYYKILFITIISCNSFSLQAQINHTIIKSDSDKISIPFQQKDTSYWIYNFKQLRDALFHHDKNKAKQFFDFPIIDSGNYIWYLASPNNPKIINQVSQAAMPFTEKDFDKYFDRLFELHFIHCFLKIKADELYKTGKAESPLFKDSTTHYQLFVTFNQLNKTFELNFATNTPYKISDTEWEAGESNTIYRFKISNKGHVKFKELITAD